MAVSVCTCLPCTLPVHSGRRPAVWGPCGAPDWPDPRGSAAQAEGAALQPSGAGWRGLYGTVPEDSQTEDNILIFEVPAKQDKYIFVPITLVWQVSNHKQKTSKRVSCLVYDHVSEEYPEPQPAVCLPRGADLLKLCQNGKLQAHLHDYFDNLTCQLQINLHNQPFNALIELPLRSITSHWETALT